MKLNIFKKPANKLTLFLRAMPSPLSVTGTVFLVVPVWSLIFMHKPWEIFLALAGWKAGVFAFTFWVGPLVLAIMAFSRHKLLVPIFFLEIGSLLLYSMVGLSTGQIQITIIHSILLGAVLFFALFLLRTDALYPLIRGASRRWRVHPRVHVGLMVKLSAPGTDKVAKVVLENCSLMGMEISGQQELLFPILGDRAQQDPWEFSLVLNQKVWSFNADLAWVHEDGGEKRLGLHISDRSKMKAFFEELPLEESLGNLSETFIRHWQKPPFRQAVLFLWTAFILAAFLVPAKIRLNPTVSKSIVTTNDTINAGLGPYFRPHKK